MFRGYRGIIVATCWLILASAPTPDRGADAENAQTAKNIEKSLESLATKQAQAVEQAKPGEYQAPCGEGEYNNQSDLCAQWYAARAAGDAAKWSFGPFGWG